MIKQLNDEGVKNMLIAGYKLCIADLLYIRTHEWKQDEFQCISMPGTGRIHIPTERKLIYDFMRNYDCFNDVVDIEEIIKNVYLHVEKEAYKKWLKTHRNGSRQNGN